MTNPVVEEAIAKTLKELEEAGTPTSRSRVATTPNGYIHLVAWSNAGLLRVLVVRFTEVLPRSQHRLKAQLDDAGRSVVANIEEGFSRPTTYEYLEYLGFSEASLAEIKGDIWRSHQDGILASVPRSSLLQLKINLQDWHQALRETVISKPVQPSTGFYRNVKEFKGKTLASKSFPSSNVLQNPLNSSKGMYRNLEEVKGNAFRFHYPPVDNLQASQLTYEIFIELINKTSWHLRRLVVSLENKLAAEGKYYQVEQLRLRSKLRFRR